MEFSTVEKMAELTKSPVLKEISYRASVFKQHVWIGANGEFDVTEEDVERDIQLFIPVYSFVSFIIQLIELRKAFKVACVYTKEPMNYGVCVPELVETEGYTFSYYDSFYQNVHFSHMKEANVFIYLSDFEYYANLYVKRR